MMTLELQNALLAEAQYIGQVVLQQGIRTRAGLNWPNIVHQGPSPYWAEKEDLYQGTGGTLLFLLELYRQTGDEIYLAASEEAEHWLLTRSPHLSHDLGSLFHGRLSLAFVWVRAFEITGQERYLTQALDWVRMHNSTLPADSDLLSGCSGTILALLHLHAATKQAWLLPLLEAAVEQLLNSCIAGPQGIYWQRSERTIHGLCGLGHGAAGVALALVELGYYFQNEAFYWLAEQAFAYEDYYYQPEHGNWPDWRLGLFRPEDENEFRTAYQQNNETFFTSGRLMNAWCHGAAGIGFARIRAYERTGNIEHLSLARVAAAKTCQTEIGGTGALSFGLCHGRSGNAALLLELFRVLKEPTYAEQANLIARRILDARPATNYLEEDNSLMVGNAGIGYFFLQLLAPESTSSVLAPRLAEPAAPGQGAGYQGLNVSLPALQQRVIRHIFPRSSVLWEHLMPSVPLFSPLPTGPAATNGPTAFSATTWMAAKREQAAKCVFRHEALLQDVLALEQQGLELDLATRSNCLLSFQELLKRERASEFAGFPDEDLLAESYVIDGCMRIANSQWKWDPDCPTDWLNNLYIPAENHPCLLQATAMGVREYALSPLRSLVLSTFTQSGTIAAALKFLLSCVEVENPVQEVEARQLLIGQIMAEIKWGTLVPPA